MLYIYPVCTFVDIPNLIKGHENRIKAVKQAFLGNLHWSSPNDYTTVWLVKMCKPIKNLLWKLCQLL